MTTLQTIFPRFAAISAVGPARRPAAGSPVRFCAEAAPVPPDTPQASPKRPTSWSNLLFFDPIIKMVAFCCLHPRLLNLLERALTPFSPHAIPDKHLPHFEPLLPVKFQSIDLESDLTLKGYWMPALPEPGKTIHPDKTVVLGHGYSASWKGMLGVGEQLRKAGYNVFMFNFRGHGNSEGFATSFGYEEGKDVAAAVNFVKKNFPAQSRKLYYMGHSMGAASLMLAPQSLKGYPDVVGTPSDHYPDALERLTGQIDGLILDSPYASLETFITNHVLALSNTRPVNRVLKFFWPESRLKELACRTRELLREEGGEVLNLRLPPEQLEPARAMAGHALAQKPILLLHGMDDQMTPYRHAERNAEFLNKERMETPKLTLVALEDTDHNDHTWEPFDNGWTFISVLRRHPRYMDSIREFLGGLNRD